MSMKRGYSRASQNSLDKMQNGTGDNSSLGTEDDRYKTLNVTWQHSTNKFCCQKKKTNNKKNKTKNKTKINHYDIL